MPFIRRVKYGAQVDVVRRLRTGLDAAVRVDVGGCVVVASERSVDILDDRLQHRRHIALPPWVPDINPTSVLDPTTGDVYFCRGLALHRVEIGRKLL